MFEFELGRISFSNVVLMNVGVCSSWGGKMGVEGKKRRKRRILTCGMGDVRLEMFGRKRMMVIM